MRDPIAAHWRCSAEVLERALRWLPHLGGACGALFAVLAATDTWVAPLWRSGAPGKAVVAAGLGLLAAPVAYGLGWLATFLVVFAFYSAAACLAGRAGSNR